MVSMADISKIHESISYIENNLKEPITVMDMALNAGHSIFHFSRTFNALTGHNPYDYLIRRRLSEAAKIIQQNDERLTDIAFEFQFNSLESFSRSFKKMFGISPNRYKTGYQFCKTALKIHSSLEYLTHINANSFFKPSPVKIKQLFLIGDVQALCRDILLCSL